MMDIKEELSSRAQSINAMLTIYMPKEEGPQKNLIAAMNYSLMGPGKRIRPILMMETFRLFGGRSDVVYPFMAAMEMIHSYSLVHDDLPAMDDDEYRRGRKTTHVEYGEAMAILAGDALLTYAFETAIKACNFEPDNPGVAKALAELARAAGVNGMAGGQSVDVELTGQRLERETLDFIYALKTGALIKASMLIGAYLAGADEKDIEKVGRAAECIGLAFQIKDDILDVTGDAEVLGKPVLSDEKNEKTTYVTFEGLEKSEADVERLSGEAIEILKSFEGPSQFLCELVTYLISREK